MVRAASRLALLVLLAPACTDIQTLPPADLMALGDSLLAGVQTWSLNRDTQRYSVPRLVALQLTRAGHLPPGFDLAQPLLREDGNRVDVEVVSDNVAVPGARLHDLLHEAAGALPVNLADLLLFPAEGTQVEILEVRRPRLVLLWAGNNDLLEAVADKDAYDNGSLTDVDELARDVDKLFARVAQVAEVVVVATLPDVTALPVLVDAEPYGGPAGSRLHRIDAESIARGERSAESVVGEPLHLLDAGELEAIRAHQLAYNAAITAGAAAHGFLLVDIEAALAQALAPGVAPFPLGPGHNQGLFSLDDTHGSNTGYALLANAFLAALNTVLDPPAALYDPADFVYADPYIDRDGDGAVSGPDFEPLEPPDGAVILRDCAPLDPLVHPGAVDTPGDDVDGDCDGTDGAAP